MKKRTLILTALTVFTIALAGCQTTANQPQNAQADNQMEAASPPGTSNTDSTNASAGLTDEEAKSIALTDANVKEEDITNIRVEKDLDDGIAVYDVDFYAGNKEYDYEIDAATGEIRSHDFDIENDFLNEQQTSDSGLLSEEEASKIVLEKVDGASEQNLRIHLERDDGQDIYEGEIRYNGMEYEFELNAKTGDILEWSKEREDD